MPVIDRLVCESNASGLLPVTVNVPPLRLTEVKSNTAIPLEVTPVNNVVEVLVSVSVSVVVLNW